MSNASLTLGLPSTVLVGRAMPKNAFYKHLATTAAIKEQFVRLIDRIEMLAVLKKASVHIPAGRHVAEIDVLGLRLHSTDDAACDVPSEAIELIAKNVPNKLLFACVAGDYVKLLVRRDRLYETAWTLSADTDVELCGATLDELWDSLSSQVVFGSSDPVDFAGRVERKSHIEALQNELTSVEKKRKNEKQISKRNALFDRARELKQELARLEAGA